MGPRSFNRGNDRRHRSGGRRLPCFNGAAVIQPRKPAETARPLKRTTCFNGAAVIQPRKPAETARPLKRTTCFNGAAVIQPRKPRGRTARWRDRSRFNGAAVIQPRKPTGFRGRPHRCRRFNGAAVIQPRKPRGSTGNRSANCRASMGPRSFNRGNRRDPTVQRHRQDRRRFNGAAVIQPRKRHRGLSRHRQAASMGPRSFNRGNRRLRTRRQLDRPLQWGRGHSTAETVPLSVGSRATAASMGPRSFNRGNAAYDHATEPSASMGPRSFNRGNDVTGRRVDNANPLARRFNGAAVIQPRKPIMLDVAGGMLQWGRGHSTAETTSGPLRTSACFNGAAVIQPRKRDPGVMPWTSTASMGPRSFNRGNALADGVRTSGRFNGAAVIQPRKPPAL